MVHVRWPIGWCLWTVWSTLGPIGPRPMAVRPTFVGHLVQIRGPIGPRSFAALYTFVVYVAHPCWPRCSRSLIAWHTVVGRLAGGAAVLRTGVGRTTQLVSSMLPFLSNILAKSPACTMYREWSIHTVRRVTCPGRPSCTHTQSVVYRGRRHLVVPPAGQLVHVRGPNGLRVGQCDKSDMNTGV